MVNKNLVFPSLLVHTYEFYSISMVLKVGDSALLGAVERSEGWGRGWLIGRQGGIWSRKIINNF